MNDYIHRGSRFQSGRGFGSLFSSFFRSMKPLVKMGINTGKRILNSDLAKSVGKTALEMGADALKNVAADALEGKNVKESLSKEVENAKSKIAQTIRGGGKKKRKLCKKPCKKNNRLVYKKGKFCLLD